MKPLVTAQRSPSFEEEEQPKERRIWMCEACIHASMDETIGLELGLHRQHLIYLSAAQLIAEGVKDEDEIVRLIAQRYDDHPYFGFIRDAIREIRGQPRMSVEEHTRQRAIDRAMIDDETPVRERNPVTRDELLRAVEEERAFATRVTGMFDYSTFAEFMQLRTPEAWASEHFCFKCGMPAQFGAGVSVREGREGEWRCLEHRLIGRE